MGKRAAFAVEERVVNIPIDRVSIEGNLSIPEQASGIVLFAHGSGSSRFSPRNRSVAQVLQERRLATLLIDLLTPEEEALDMQTAELRFDISLLARRLMGTTDWLKDQPETRGLNLGYFGASTGASAALTAAAERPDEVKAVVSRGGRPDLAMPSLAAVRAPTLLIVGGYDYTVLDLNRQAFRQLNVEKKLAVVPEATHLFEEPGALDEVARLAEEWFVQYLGQ